LTLGIDDRANPVCKGYEHWESSADGVPAPHGLDEHGGQGLWEGEAEIELHLQ
jgi:hypothetical protein